MKLTARPVIALTLCAGLAGATGLTAASAAPKPVCKLITDPAGDSTGPTQTLDVVSGDIASTAKTVTGVIRVANLAETDPTSPTGLAWSLRFTAPNKPLPMYLLATKSARGDVGFSFGEVDGTSLRTLGGGTGILDIAKKEIRIHVKAADIRLKPGAELTGLFVQGRRFVGVPGTGLYSNADASDPSTSQPYKMGQPSCVKPGK